MSVFDISESQPDDRVQSLKNRGLPYGVSVPARLKDTLEQLTNKKEERK